MYRLLRSHLSAIGLTSFPVKDSPVTLHHDSTITTLVFVPSNRLQILKLNARTRDVPGPLMRRREEGRLSWRENTTMKVCTKEWRVVKIEVAYDCFTRRARGSTWFNCCRKPIAGVSSMGLV